MWQAAGAIEVYEQVGAEPKQMVFLKYGASVVPLVPWGELEPHLPDRAAA